MYITTEEARMIFQAKEDAHEAWLEIICRHPLLARLHEVEPQGVDYFLWTIGYYPPKIPSVNAFTIAKAFEEAEKRRESLEEQITRHSQ